MFRRIVMFGLILKKKISVCPDLYERCVPQLRTSEWLRCSDVITCCSVRTDCTSITGSVLMGCLYVYVRFQCGHALQRTHAVCMAVLSGQDY